MRATFKVQYELGATPIEKIAIPLDSRDELPPVLRGLQYIYHTPELQKQVFDLLATKILAGVNSTGRTGMSLWEILVFSSVRLALNNDYDRLHHIANYDSLVRSFVGISNFGANLKKYSLQTLKDNIRLLDDETVNSINKLINKAMHRQRETKKLNVKIDTYVFETNVHFPTDFNLLRDACRKSLDLVQQIYSAVEIPGWRKYKQWRQRIKNAYHRAAKRCRGAGKTTEQGLTATLEYLTLAESLSQKLTESIQLLQILLSENHFQFNKFRSLLYFKGHLDKHIDLVRRRIIYREQIPHEEKVFSLFEPHTEWITKGKIRNEVELGCMIAIATDQHDQIIGYRILKNEHDVDIAVPFANELLSDYNIESLSFDKGFWNPENYNELKGLVNKLILPKKGKLSKAETERESNPTFKELRRKHAAVESAINCLEHHGLNRCPDKGDDGYRRYTALGVLAYNLHKLGNMLIKKDNKLPSSKNVIKISI